MKLYKISKIDNKKIKLNILDEIQEAISKEGWAEFKEIHDKVNMILYSLKHFSEYDLYIELIKIWKKAVEIDDFLNTLNTKVKITSVERFIKGGETLIKHDYIIIGKNKYLAGEVVC